MSTDTAAATARTLLGKTRAALIELFLMDEDESYYMRQVVRLTGLGHGAVQRELSLLTDAGIITRSRKGNLVYYQANNRSPVFSELRSIVVKGLSPGYPEGKAPETAARLSAAIGVPLPVIEEICRRYHVRRLSVFGSAARGALGPESDVDLLAEFESGTVPGLEFFDLEAELSEKLGRKVDLNTPGFLSRYFRERVIEEAETLYAS
jgi:predicted nucleotidyltransferase